MKLKVSELYAFLEQMYITGPLRTAFLIGPPGIGKSSIGKMLATKLEISLVEKELSNIPLEDLPGLPDFTLDRSTVVHRPLKWLYDLCQPGVKAILVLDDLPAASAPIHAATRQLVLDRTINGWKLSDGVLILVTGNRKDDRAGAGVLPSHFCNAVSIFELEPDFTEWCSWYSHQHLDPLIPQFLSTYRALPTGGDMFSMLPKDADSKGSFPTPRSWSDFGSQLPLALPLGMKTTEAVASAWVGANAAAQFTLYLQTRATLPDPVAVLMGTPLDYQRLDTPDKKVAMIAALAHVGLGKHLEVELLSCLADLPEAEYGLLGVQAFLNVGGSYGQLHTAMRSLLVQNPARASAELFRQLKLLS